MINLKGLKDTHKNIPLQLSVKLDGGYLVSPPPLTILKEKVNSWRMNQEIISDIWKRKNKPKTRK